MSQSQIGGKTVFELASELEVDASIIQAHVNGCWPLKFYHDLITPEQETVISYIVGLSA